MSESVESLVKELSVTSQRHESEIKELYVAMGGTVDGSKTGFGQHLQNVMKELSALATEMKATKERVTGLEFKATKYEGLWGGARGTLVAIGGLIGIIVGILGVKVFHL